MTIALSAPSKTFLVGEYAVLRGGPALLLNTSPRFALTAVQTGTQSLEGISEGAPAERWLKQRAPVWAGWELNFSDPHAGQGGFGASGAQFLLAHALTTFMQSSVARVAEGYDIQALWNDFRVLSEGQGSGADMLAQSVGQAALVDVREKLAVARAWPFAELGFAIVRTGKKVQTHEHLRGLVGKDLESLVPLAKTCVETFTPGAATSFVRAVSAYAEALVALDLQAPETVARCAELAAEPWCRAVKGCGALGADTILVLFLESERQLALSALPGAVTDRELSSGLQMNWSWS